MVRNKPNELIYNIKDGDCPIFVPILINERDSVRKSLIENSIYLPIHWPSFEGVSNDIVNKELSLVCDQRYKEDVIEDYINKLIKIVGE